MELELLHLCDNLSTNVTFGDFWVLVVYLVQYFLAGKCLVGITLI